MNTKERFQEFIEKSTKLHGNKYDYSNVEYKNSYTKVCPKCSFERHKLTKISSERLEKLKLVHNNRYVYKSLEVKNGIISILCPNHGKFSQNIHAHGKGHGCLKCYLTSTKEEKLKKCKSCKEEILLSKFSPRFQICKSCQENPIIPKHKTCINCKIEKNIEEFPIRKSQWDGYRNECIKCFSEKTKIIKKEYRKKNKSIIREKDRIYRKNRMKSDILFRIKIMSRNVIRKSISKKGYTKKTRTYEILGCSYEEFKIHIENLFLEDMNWENRHLWDIDHIVPISLAESEYEMEILNHHSNLRPLWKTANEYKSDNITEEVKRSPIYKELLDNRKISFPSIYFGSFNVAL